MRAVPACFLVQEPACGMIPWHEPVVEKQMAMSGRGHAVFVRRASEPGVRCQSGEVDVDGASERPRQKNCANYAFHFRNSAKRSTPSALPVGAPAQSRPGRHRMDIAI